jgi:hypothetical protein
MQQWRHKSIYSSEDTNLNEMFIDILDLIIIFIISQYLDYNRLVDKLDGESCGHDCREDDAVEN